MTYNEFAKFAASIRPGEEVVISGSRCDEYNVDPPGEVEGVLSYQYNCWYFCSDSRNWHGGHHDQAREAGRKYAWALSENYSPAWGKIELKVPFVSEDEI